MTRDRQLGIGDCRLRIGGVEGRVVVHTSCLAEFVSEHWEACATWKREEILGWVRWFQLRGLAFWHCDELGRIDALILGRPVLNIRLAENRYHYTTGASVWWVDLLCVRAEGSAPLGRILREFYRAARLRLGLPAEIAWERWTRRKTARSWPIAAVARRIEAGAGEMLFNKK